ncbi:MAG: zinc ribbon domain-containing protein [Eubacterium sp.]|nr:zinc ribbon domain-containing protein [Eubacterium sp.]
MIVMKCPHCYTELPDTAKMCYNCKMQLRTDESEGDTSKICPNCGMSLPLTAKMCYCCKYVFSATETLMAQNPSAYQLRPSSANSQSGYNTGTRGPYYQSGSRNPSIGKADKSSDSLRRTAMIVCLIGAILSGVATFMPYIGITIFGTSSSVSIMDNTSYGIENLFWAAMSLLFCVPKRQKSGTGHIILGAFGIAGCIFNSIRISNIFEYSNLVQKQVGFYTLLIGSVMVLVSGIIMRIAYKNE